MEKPVIHKAGIIQATIVASTFISSHKDPRSHVQVRYTDFDREGNKEPGYFYALALMPSSPKWGNILLPDKVKESFIEAHIPELTMLPPYEELLTQEEVAFKTDSIPNADAIKGKLIQSVIEGALEQGDPRVIVEVLQDLAEHTPDPDRDKPIMLTLRNKEEVNDFAMFVEHTKHCTCYKAEITEKDRNGNDSTKYFYVVLSYAKHPERKKKVVRVPLSEYHRFAVDMLIPKTDRVPQDDELVKEADLEAYDKADEQENSHEVNGDMHRYIWKKN
jgi:hypothetical protein